MSKDASNCLGRYPVDKDLKDVALTDFVGKCKALNIVASLDTFVCADSARNLMKL